MVGRSRNKGNVKMNTELAPSANWYRRGPSSQRGHRRGTRLGGRGGNGRGRSPASVASVEAPLIWGPITECSLPLLPPASKWLIYDRVSTRLEFSVENRVEMHIFRFSHTVLFFRFFFSRVFCRRRSMSY